jgi:hypothetical protein
MYAATVRGLFFVCILLSSGSYVQGDIVNGPGNVQLDIDPRMHFPVPNPSLVPLIHEGKSTLPELIREGENNWFNYGLLEGEPFGVPEEIFDFLFGKFGTPRHEPNMHIFEGMVHSGLPYFQGEDLPRGMVRTTDPLNRLVTQTCSACHSGTVNNHFIPGVGNKWYDQQSIINTVGVIMKATIPILKLGGKENEDLLHRTEFQLAKLNRYQALYGIGCDDLAPGMVTGARIWQISSKLLNDPAQLETPEGRKKFLCGSTKSPPLNTLRFRNIFFWDGSVNTQWVAHWPLFDFFGFGHYDEWVKKVLGREMQSIDAFLTFNTKSPSWEEIMGTHIDSEKAEKGFKLFHKDQACASCHGTYSEKGMLLTFKPGVVPLALIGTDTERSDSAFDELMNAFAEYGWAYVPRIDGLQKDYPPGYQSYPLCSTFLNYPYLHTAAVANLDELLLPEEKRSQKYWLSDSLDKNRVGFYTSTLPGPTDPGLSSRMILRKFRKRLSDGHSGERFGTNLNPGNRANLVEYLKTLRCPEGS